ncbi:MAG: hypothetical protein ACJ78Q_05390 [Chloroflexia bacterium]
MEKGIRSLEDWVEAQLSKPLSALDAAYSSLWAADAELDSKFGPRASSGSAPPEKRAVREVQLWELHAHTRGADCEDGIWTGVINHCSHPLPQGIAKDLIERRVAIDALGHSRQVDEAQRRLASFYGEALVTLAVDMYTNPQYTAEEFGAMLVEFRDSPGYFWALETLASHEPSGEEKQEAYLLAVRERPEAERLLHRNEVYQRVMEARKPEMTEQKAIALFDSGEPEVWEALAKHPGTPVEVLRALAGVRGVKSARVIRERARENLKGRTPG